MQESSSPAPAHIAIASVLKVRNGVLQALVWQRAIEPFADAWSLPGGYLEPGETLEQSIRRHLAVKVDVRELSHLEQLETLSDPARAGCADHGGIASPPGESSTATMIRGMLIFLPALLTSLKQSGAAC